MAIHTHTQNEGWAHRLGMMAGRAWRKSAQGERKAVAWLTAQGVPGSGARALLWLAKIVLLAALLYLTVWLALIVLFVVAAAWTARNMDWDDENKPEWREGHSGFGLYDKNEWRHDAGDPDEP